ncbi:cell division protein ZapA [Candidatus Liberibacter sp.]|uniref:cell division protein ZapA n=1 Tax=Candidatus Liberibacter sp. TaxID=34022 RepID=UPI0015F7559B|nr:cell division protein ZapA [Candidatus Liberibacter sp.]MBA5723647.1 cell division protein ZapA [Candidatus Liberibacter sp.]
MPQITVEINGKKYKMACKDGQEEQLIHLAERFGSYVDRLRQQFGDIGDLRLTVMAGVTLMDEMAHLSCNLKKTQEELSNLSSNFNKKMLSYSQQDKEIILILQDFATRIRSLSTRIESKNYS